MGLHFENRIPIHQALSHCYCESMSHIETTPRSVQVCRERETVDYKRQAAPGAAITGNGAILLFSHSSSEQRRSERGPSQAMRTADRDPAGGEIPVELTANSRLMTSYVSRGVEDKKGYSKKLVRQ